MVATFKKFEKWHIRYISDMKTTLFRLSNCLMCGIAVTGVKHLVLTRTGDLLTTGRQVNMALVPDLVSGTDMQILVCKFILLCLNSVG